MTNLKNVQTTGMFKGLPQMIFLILLVFSMSGNLLAQSDYFKTNQLSTASIYVIAAKHSKMVFDVPSSKDGTQIIQYTKHGGANQQFTLISASNGYYYLKSVGTGKVLDFAGSNLVISSDARTVNQQFKLIDMGSGYCMIQSRRSGNYLDVVGSSKSNGAKIVQYSSTKNPNQLFKFELKGSISVENAPAASREELSDYVLTAKIKCTEEDDGGGSAEEIFGKLYVKTPSGQKTVWQKSEDAHVEIVEGRTYTVPGMVMLSSLGLDDELVLGGHLKEEDTGGDDDLGSKEKTVSVRGLFAKPESIRFTHDDTKIDVTFTLKPKKTGIGNLSDCYVTIEKVKCIVPSKGTDQGTEAAVGIGIGISSVVGGTAVGFVNPGVGAKILVIGLQTAIFSSGDIVSLYNKVHAGSDDVYLKVNDKKVWPSDKYKKMNSQQSFDVNKTFKGTNVKVEIMEYDSGSGDDYMGGFTFDLKEALNSSDWKRAKDAKGNLLADGNILEAKILVYDEEEGSTYEVYLKAEFL